MLVDTFAIGDYFYTEGGTFFIRIKDIRCVFNSEQDRWEAEVVYDEGASNCMNLGLVLKAANFVRMIRDRKFDQKVSYST